MNSHAESEIKQIFNKQRTAFYNASIPTLKQRIASLNYLHHLLVTNKERLIDAVAEDYASRTEYETILEIFSTLEEIKYAKRHLKKWIKEKKINVSFWFKFAYSKIIPQPLGVVGIIASWNCPINLTLGPLIGALAAGNRIMIKASEFAPVTTQLLKNIIANYFSDEEIAIITGNSNVSKMFASLPFDHLLFTGSSKVARSVLSTASHNLTPVTLELGGKSPVIIGKDVDLQMTVKKIIFGKLFNAGQVCLAPDYILLPKEYEKEFITIAKKTIATSYPEILQNPNYTNVINASHMERLQYFIDDAKAHGAEIIPLTDEDQIRSENKFVPIVILNTQPNMLIMQEEIFGPLLPLINYENVQEAIRYINTRDKPLGLYYFGRDKREADYVLQNTFSGGATVNDIGLHFSQPNLPFGGVGASGMGHYHGEYGFNTFSKLKPVFYQHRWSFINLLYPPYGKIIKLVTKLMIR